MTDVDVEDIKRGMWYQNYLQIDCLNLIYNV